MFFIKPCDTVAGHTSPSEEADKKLSKTESQMSTKRRPQKLSYQSCLPILKYYKTFKEEHNKPLKS